MALAAAICVLAPVPARADLLVAPFFAWTRNPDTSRWVNGGGLAIEWSRDWVIAGGDLGYGAGYFDPEEDVTDLVQSSHVLTFAGHAGVTKPARSDDERFLPYGTIGFGAMRQQARDREGLIDVTRTDPAMHFGGGIRIHVNQYLGVRVDLRHFRSLRDPFEAPDALVADLERLNFWRLGIGAVLRFGRD